VARKKKINNSKKRLMILGPICFVILGTFIFNATFYFHRILVLEKSKSELENQLVVLKEKEAILNSDIQKLKDPEYIAKFARENYMYSKDGEYIIKIDPEQNVVSKVNNSFNYWYVVFGVSLFTLIVLIIFFRKKNED
jgi:cell division protein DivIC